MPKLVAVALCHRDRLSEGNSRRIFGYEAYHWGILIMPPKSTGKDCYSFEATDASYIDPVTMRMVNPAMNWWLREGEAVDLALNAKHLGRLEIGELALDMSFDELGAFFKHIPLPAKNTEPQQSCVTWVIDAIQELQRQGLVPRFDIDDFKNLALSYADDRMLGAASAESSVKRFIN